MCYECANDVPNLAYDAMSGRCVCASGYYRVGDVCKECHMFCGECTGPSNAECVAGKCGRDSYALHLVATTCLQMCESEEMNLFIDTSTKTCKSCVHPCKSCFDATDESCTSCVDGYYLYKNACKSECPDKHFGSDGVCLICDSRCIQCTKRTNYCTVGCEDPYVYKDHQCLDECGDGYINVNRICEPCGSDCTECTQEGSLKKCLKCRAGRYLHEGACAELCPSGYYRDTYGGKCGKCNQACAECSGSGSRSCYSCNRELGYVMVAEGTCSLPSCVDGNYYDEELKLCVHCPKECSKCIGPVNCTACVEGYSFDYVKKSCYDPCDRVGFTRKAGSFECMEICGDGRNMGMVECDDGNLKDNDGCSSKCKTEPYYECSGGTQDSPDVCVYRKPVDVLSFKYSADRSAILTFDAKIRLLGTLEDAIDFSLNRAEVASVKWSHEYFDTKKFVRIKFRFEFACSLIGVEVGFGCER